MKLKPTSQLYHQFLKPQQISEDYLPLLVAKLYEASFIELYQDEVSPDVEKYSETEKLTSRQHRDELFKIVNSLKGLV